MGTFEQFLRDNPKMADEPYGAATAGTLSKPFLAALGRGRRIEQIQITISSTRLTQNELAPIGLPSSRMRVRFDFGSFLPLAELRRRPAGPASEGIVEKGRSLQPSNQAVWLSANGVGSAATISDDHFASFQSSGMRKWTRRRLSPEIEVSRIDVKRQLLMACRGRQQHAVDFKQLSYIVIS
jgi:hypothetical protein